MAAVYRFHGDLSELLRPKWNKAKEISQPVTRRASIKDTLEAFGLPHTEIFSIQYNDNNMDFSFLVEENQFFDVFPVQKPWDVTTPTILRPEPLEKIHFMVDVNVGRLAKYLRMVGFDVLYDPEWRKQDIIDKLKLDRRIVLTRDLELLKRKQVEFGRYVRCENPVEQLYEIIDLFGIKDKLSPFSRCLECNTRLVPVEKDTILDRLEPLTKKYYDSFSICPDCERIYWAGSHIDRMKKILYEK